MSFLFLAWICIAAVCDARYRKSFNWIALPGFFLAFISLIFFPGAHPVNIDFYSSMLGSFIAFGAFLIFYLLKVMGAGDVKFAAVLGAWIGWELLLPIWALSCGFAVLHGLVVRSNLKYFFSTLMNWADGRSEKGKKFIPYVTYLSIATVIVLMLNK